ncbi:hypothetical protein JW886_07470 [Lactococcus taiwanensis]|uniref:DUF2187 domain-containing protein n=1 Tax=Lactococcus taiwanensis TaxID=1151742 RepID=A0AA45QRD1_9LACT|nr:hypothetical protein [Lactococcus taiwanensis]QSE76301.1 hypothetical protein JW886_07470 [Lactococcus taiwanensis]
MEFKIGEAVYLPESKYPGVVGTVIAENKKGILVSFNGTQQLYFEENELQSYKK